MQFIDYTGVQFLILQLSAAIVLLRELGGSHNFFVTHSIGTFGMAQTEDERDLDSLIRAFHELPGFADSALLHEVIEMAVKRFDYSGDEQLARELLRESSEFSLQRMQDPQTGQPRWVIQRRANN